jgi:uncharacterized protein (TIGR03067 family)
VTNRFATAGLLAFTLAGCGKDAPVPVPPPTGSAVVQDDASRIRGLWAAVALRREEGKPDEIPGNYTVRFENGNYTMQLGADSTESGKFTLLPTVSPKQIDMETNENELRRGLYALDGDKLTICLPDQTGAPRPAEIKALAEGNRITVVTFTRTK